MQTFPRKKLMTELEGWAALQQHADRLKTFRMTDAFAGDAGRFERYQVKACGLQLDYSRNLVDDDALAALIQLAREAGLDQARHDLLTGTRLNTTEHRPALHSALRRPEGCPPIMAGEENTSEAVEKVLSQMNRLINLVWTGEWTGFSGQTIKHVVNIGIGGSYLGPRLITDALSHLSVPELDIHFVANIDGRDIQSTLKKINPARTLFIVASKSFSTMETLENAKDARRWILDNGAQTSDLAKHFVAVSSRPDKAAEFGINPDNVYPMWDWVGGRYSLWSAIGLPIAMSIGMRAFRTLLEGAHSMDRHFAEAPLESNMPVLMGLLGVWYMGFYDAHTQAILPYDASLQYLPAYLQQLDMESNGKSVTHDGRTPDYHTGPIIWGDLGTNGQHAYHQLLHQGTRLTMVDFIATLTSAYESGEHHSLLFANCLAQSRALMTGRNLKACLERVRNEGCPDDDQERMAHHLVIPGNRPSNTLLMHQVSPTTLGALIALYEHKVFVQSVMWNINAFDQWGVELGKELSDTLYPLLSDESCTVQADPATLELARIFREHRNGKTDPLGENN